MPATAYQIQYRQQFITGFDQYQSILRDAVTTESVIKGNQAIFLIADAGGAETVTRGVDGLIPARADNLTQVTTTLTEEHDLVRKTGFNVFASQGNQVEIMIKTTMGSVNRRIDRQILDALTAATTSVNTVASANAFKLALAAKTRLGQNEVSNDGKLCAIISPAFEANLLSTTEFASADYVQNKPFAMEDLGYKDGPGYYVWMGVKWMVHPTLSGVGTASETCFMYHKDAIGHAIDVKGIDARTGYDEEQDYSYARTSFYGGAKLLQQNGVVKMLHDATSITSV